MGRHLIKRRSMSWKRCGRKQKGNRSYRTYRTYFTMIELVVDLQRPHDLIERIIKSALILRRYGNHVEQLSVPQLRRDQPDGLRTPGGLVDVRQRRPQRRAPVERSSLITTARAQVVISLREAVDQLLSRTLQVTAI